MKKVLCGVALFMVAVFCINMGPGKYADSVAGDKLEEFFVQDKQNVLSATIIDNRSKIMGYGICFYDRSDDDFRRDDGTPVGLTSVNAYHVGRSGETMLRLEDIVALQVVRNPETSSPFFHDKDRGGTRLIKVRVASRDEKGGLVKYERYLDQDIAFGYLEKVGVNFEPTRVLLRQINSIGKIKKMEDIPKKLFEKELTMTSSTR